jgi:hypothetical protein
MTDEEYRQMVEKRWRESMELLGVDPGPQPAPTKHPEREPEPAAEEPVAELPSAEEPAPPEPPAEVATPPMEYTRPAVRAHPLPRRLPEAEPIVEEPAALPVAQATVEDTPEPVAEEETAVKDDSEEPGAEKASGRRRGRRGRRSSRGKKSETPDTEAGVTEAPAAKEAEEPAEEEAPSRRGRGRSRPKQANTTDTEAADQDEAAAHAADDTEASDDEPDETLSEWNVPSWQELIASLYRPER